MPYAGTGRYFYRKPSDSRFDYQRNSPGSDSAWHTTLSTDEHGAAYPNLMPPYPTRALLDSLAAKKPALSSSNDIVTLSYNEAHTRIRYRIDRNRWLIISRTVCVPEQDSCRPAAFPPFHYRYETLDGIPVVSSITAFPPDSVDSAGLYSLTGGFRFTNIHINEPLHDSLFEHSVNMNRSRSPRRARRTTRRQLIAAPQAGADGAWYNSLGRNMATADGTQASPPPGVYMYAPVSRRVRTIIETRR